MIIDLYKTVGEHPEYFRQLKCGDLLFTQYDCPQEALKQDLFSASNYIAYVMSGKRLFHLPGETHLMTEGASRSFFHSMLPYFLQQPAPPESLIELKFRELLFNLLINPANGPLLAWLCSKEDCPR